MGADLDAASCWAGPPTTCPAPPLGKVGIHDIADALPVAFGSAAAAAVIGVGLAAIFAGGGTKTAPVDCSSGRLTPAVAMPAGPVLELAGAAKAAALGGATVTGPGSGAVPDATAASADTAASSAAAQRFP